MKCMVSCEWSFSESDDRGEGSIELIVNLILIEN